MTEATEHSPFGGQYDASAGRDVSVSADTGRWVTVWDLPTRFFRWLLVLLVAAGVFTGFVAPEWWMGVHAWAGYGLAAPMVFRMA